MHLPDVPAPKVSVVMPAYNAAAFITEAIESILNQSYSDFEFIIVNDGSVDETVKIINTYPDSRIHLINFQQNQGLPVALSAGIKNAWGEYIVRMDADDVAVPHRIAVQVEYMDAHPGVGLCGGLARTMNGKKMNEWMPNSRLKLSMLLRNPIVHSTVIIRRSVLDSYSLRYEGFAEDYRLWARIAEVTQVAVIPEVLLYYRLAENQFSVRFGSKQSDDSDQIRVSLFEKVLLRPLSDAEKIIVINKGEKGIMLLRPLVDFARILMGTLIQYQNPKEDVHFVVNKLLKKNIGSIRFRWNDILAIPFVPCVNFREKIYIMKLWAKQLAKSPK